MLSESLISPTASSMWRKKKKTLAPQKRGFQGVAFFGVWSRLVWSGGRREEALAQLNLGTDQGEKGRETEKGGVSGRRQKEEEAPSPSLSFAHIAKRATQKIASCGFFFPLFTHYFFRFFFSRHISSGVSSLPRTRGERMRKRGGEGGDLFHPFPFLFSPPPSPLSETPPPPPSAGGEGRGRGGGNSVGG